MEPIKFKATFVTPLLIHSAKPREADPLGLTGKALRGAWRFWFRAIVGGAIPSIAPDDLKDIEGSIFGSSDEGVGATFRMSIVPDTQLVPDKNIYPGFVKPFKFRGYPKGSKFTVRLLPRCTLGPTEQNVLLATVWLWAALGAVGQRTRRGFGSPHIVQNEGHNDFVNIGLSMPETFQDRESVVTHLSNGLVRIWYIYKEWLEIKGHPVSGLIDTNPAPPKPQYFILAGLSQITVGGQPEKDMNNALTVIHGSDQCKGIGWVDPASRKRFASPVFTRLYETGSGYLPVATYSFQDTGIPCGIKGHSTNYVCLQSYLNSAHCTVWLNGGGV